MKRWLFCLISLLVGGTWTDLPLATSPYTVTPSGSQKFYRLRCP